MRGIHRWPVNSPHKGPVTRKMFPFDDVIMTACAIVLCWLDWLLNGVPGHTLNTLRPGKNGRHFTGHFQVHFLEHKLWISKQNFAEICSVWPNRHYGSIGSDNGLAPNRRQAIIWTVPSGPMLAGFTDTYVLLGQIDLRCSPDIFLYLQTIRWQILSWVLTFLCC